MKHLPSAIVVSVSAPVNTNIVRDCEQALCPGGLLFVYGAPPHLASWGEQLSRRLTFKYWIALDIHDAPRRGFLKPTHQGLLLYWKPGPSYPLNTGAVRIPHAYCSACGLTLKDWGGKKHLMNPKGAALSDVWRDLPRRRLKNTKLPADVARRIRALAGKYRHVAA